MDMFIKVSLGWKQNAEKTKAQKQFFVLMSVHVRSSEAVNEVYEGPWEPVSLLRLCLQLISC